MNPYEKLANGIIEQAVKDYRWAAKALKKNSSDDAAKHTIAETDRFFSSAWFSRLTDIDGVWLSERLQKE